MPEAEGRLAAPLMAWSKFDGATSPAPRPGVVDLWRVDLDRAVAEADLARLTDAERARAGRFRFDADRRRFIAGRLAFGAVLAGYFGAEAVEGALRRTDAGQPLLRGKVKGVAVSFSRSEGRAVMAVAGGRALGVDIEIVREKADLPLVAREQFSQAEQAEIAALAAERRLEGFYRAWTAREALVKATGEGLNAHLARLRVCVDPARPARLLAGFSGYRPGRWRLAAFAVDGETLGCLALDRPIVRINAYDAAK